MTTIKVRRGTATQWANVNPVLAAGEPGWDSTNNVQKVGDGTTAWASLPVVNNGTYATILTPPTGLTYNADGTVATQTLAGVTTSYTYNTDGTVATEVRAGTTRTYTYNVDGTLASVA